METSREPMLITKGGISHNVFAAMTFEGRYGLPINKRLGITIDTYANIFSDEPDAGRNIFENDDIHSLDASAKSRE
ncbi:hypothetical protein E4U15_003609 [Claviceps sp. LM218 group G6]|nr:hypothetical protein E4U15_003609 [Claviceps sp. LM218 group G6]